MSLNIEIEDGRGGTKHTAKVTSRGQLVVAPLEFSETYFNFMDVDNQVYNFAEPRAGQRFVITGMLINGSRSIGTSGAVVEIYEADAIDSGTVSKALFTIDLAKSASLSVNPLNVIINSGMWLNGRTDDDDVYLTILGYYVEV